jgi:hypothetical protein
VKIIQAIGSIAGATLVTGLLGVAVAYQAEESSTCDAQYSARLLEMNNLTQQLQGVQIEQLNLAVMERLDVMQGIPHPAFAPEMDKIVQHGEATSKKAIAVTDQAQKLLEYQCKDEKQWYHVMSILLAVVTAALAGFSAWIGIRLEHDRQFKAAEEHNV